MPTQVALNNLLLDAIATQLNTKLISDLGGTPDEGGTEGIPDGNPEAIAGLVRVGNLQDDPTKYRLTLTIHPATETWPNSIWDYRFAVGFQMPNAYEIGGPYPVGMWLKRFRVQLVLFYIGEQDRVVARTKSEVVMSRAVHALMTMPMSIATDSFGETVSNIQVTQTHMLEQGGPGTFIHRGEILLEFLTQLDPSNTP